MWTGKSQGPEPNGEKYRQIRNDESQEYPAGQRVPIADPVTSDQL